MVKNYLTGLIAVPLVGLSTIVPFSISAVEPSRRSTDGLLQPHQLLRLAEQTLTTTIQFEPPPPPDLGEPKGRVSGGRRGECKRYEAVAALVPTMKIQQQDSLWGLTTSDRPTLWVYFPQGLAANLSLGFAIQDGTGQPIYKTTVTTSAATSAATAGVMAFELPASASALQPNQLYQWELAVYCGAEIDVPIKLRGNVKKTVLSPAQAGQLAMAQTPFEQARLYAKWGIWYDALTALGMAQRLEQTQELRIAWQTLLQQVKLEEAATVPILSSETLK